MALNLKGGSNLFPPGESEILIDGRKALMINFDGVSSFHKTFATTYDTAVSGADFISLSAVVKNDHEARGFFIVFTIVRINIW